MMGHCELVAVHNFLFQNSMAIWLPVVNFSCSPKPKFDKQIVALQIIIICTRPLIAVHTFLPWVSFAATLQSRWGRQWLAQSHPRSFKGRGKFEHETSPSLSNPLSTITLKTLPMTNFHVVECPMVAACLSWTADLNKSRGASRIKLVKEPNPQTP